MMRLPPSRRTAALLLLSGALCALTACRDARADDGAPDEVPVAPAAPQAGYTTTPAGTPVPPRPYPIDGLGEAPGGEYPVPPPPFSEGIFPCSDCHADMETNPERRELADAHTEIVLQHGPRERWCFDCHNPEDRNVLRLASGATVPFSESYRLCGQCHGPKLRDWRVGVHGQRSGQWDGPKRYLLCAHCHNPHAPRFRAVQPMPPPPRPENLR